MIPIRCKACNRLNLEVSEEATGTLRIVCKRASCKRTFTITLPVGVGKEKNETSLPIGHIKRVACNYPLTVGKDDLRENTIDD